MPIDGASIITWIIVGGVAGWLAGLLVQGGGFGIIGDIVIGIVGAVIAGYLLPAIGISLGAGIIAAILDAPVSTANLKTAGFPKGNSAVLVFEPEAIHGPDRLPSSHRHHGRRLGQSSLLYPGLGDAARQEDRQPGRRIGLSSVLRRWARVAWKRCHLL